MIYFIFILILALLYAILICRRRAAELYAAYEAIATLEMDGMIDRDLARVRAEPVEPPHYETTFDAQLSAPRDWAAEAQMAFDRR